MTSQTKITEIETARLMSVLSETPQLIQHDDRNLVAFAGTVMPLSSFSTLFLWAICGPKIYHSIWRESGHIKAIRELNPDDAQMHHWHDDTVGQFLVDRFLATMRTLHPDMIQSMLGQMLGVDPEE